MTDDYKLLGVLSVAILILGLSFVLIKWPKDRHSSFSQHVAVRKSSILYYIALFAVFLPLFNIFLLAWFVPTFKVTGWFPILVVSSSAFQMLCTLVPETGGQRSRYHRVLAGLSGLLLVPASTLLLFAPSISNFNKTLIGFGLITMLVVTILVSISRGMHKNFLILQIAYYLGFLLPILAVGYLQ